MTIIRATRPAAPMAFDRASIKGMGFTRLALDRASVRSKDRDGRLHVSMTNISKASVDPYYGSEIPDGERLGLEPKKIYYLLRSPDELKAAAATFNNLPVLSKHVPVSAKAPQQELVVGSTGTDANFEDPYLRNSAVITVQEAIDKIEDETQREWSCGYYYTADMTPGTFGGLRYDGVMRNIEGNHVALVDAGRAGPDVVVGDRLPEGLYMKRKFKTQTALMLNGALASHLGPMLAMDAKLDLSKALSGVTAKNVGVKPAVLAARIVKAAAPKLAQDAELDADDVVKVIAAIQGSTADITEDEDVIPDDDVDGSGDGDDIPAADAENDTLAKVLAFLKGKISDEDMAELGTMCGTGAADEEPGAPPGGKKPEDVKPAMDAATVKRTVAQTMAEMRVAEREVYPHIGEVKIACDSASDVYKLALDHAKVSTKGVHPSAFRAMVGMLRKGEVKAPIAMDHATVRDDFGARFPNAVPLLPS